MNVIRNATKTVIVTLAAAAALIAASPASAQMIFYNNLCRTWYANGLWAGDFRLSLPPAPIGTACYWTFPNGITVFGQII